MDEKDYKKNIINKMKEVNTYNKSFEHAINVLARTLSDYERTIDKFEDLGGSMVIKHTNKNGSTNIVKNPLYQAIEKLRDDILSYSKELGLTPAGLKRINDKGLGDEKESTLAKALRQLG